MAWTMRVCLLVGTSRPHKTVTMLIGYTHLITIVVLPLTLPVPAHTSNSETGILHHPDVLPSPSPSGRDMQSAREPLALYQLIIN